MLVRRIVMWNKSLCLTTVCKWRFTTVCLHLLHRDASIVDSHQCMLPCGGGNIHTPIYHWCISLTTARSGRRLVTIHTPIPGYWNYDNSISFHFFPTRNSNCFLFPANCSSATFEW